MKVEIIKSIFTNLLFAIGVILAVIGFTSGTTVVVRSLVFDEYPLRNYEETRCDTGSMAKPMPLGEREAVLVAEDVAKQKIQYADLDEETLAKKKEAIQEAKDSCENSIKHSRKVKQVEDITNSISLLVAGLVLAKVFKS